MKVGIYGGSFNPIHMGHLKIIIDSVILLKLDRLIIVPVGIPSHKNVLGGDENRFHMCKLATRSQEVHEIIESHGIKDVKSILDKIEVSRVEIEKKGTSYTYDTLISLKKEFTDSEIYEIIGEDSAYNIMSWKNYNGILNESKVVVFKRERDNKEKNKENNKENSKGNINQQLDEFLSEMLILNTPYYHYSSSEIRDRIKENKSIEGMVTQNVENYIVENKLYK